MAQKSRTKKDKQIEELSTMISTNAKATMEGPRKKHFSPHDLKTVKPLNHIQETMFESFFQGNNIIAHGSAGTGKSFVALYLALAEMLNKQNGVFKIIIVRSAVQNREIGHLPGSIEEKLAVYELPYKDIVNHLMGKYDAYDTMKSLGCIEFIPTSFVRGLTWDNAIIFIDEIQNMNFHEINSVVTRTGENSRIIACGDVAQNDLFNKKNELTGMPKFLNVARRSNVFDEIIFTRDDIVRSGFVKKWICAVEDDDANVVSLKAA
jgi:phosphate starvation-inducible protein PhoH